MTARQITLGGESPQPPFAKGREGGMWKAWLVMARIPFHSVGVLPFALGSVIAWRSEAVFNWGLWFWGTLGVVFIMLSTYFFGEYFDYPEDCISHASTPSKFAGGSGVLPSGIFPRTVPFYGGIGALVMAAAIGLIIQFGYGTGPWTIPLGMIGMIGGILYSTPPIRWVSTGFGELWIGLCYGFLAVTVGFYLPTSRIEPLVLIVSIPIAATIFNVILANEYPDYKSDLAVGKRNMLVRFGPVNGARVYVAVSFVGWISALFCVAVGVPLIFLVFYVVPLLLSVYASREFVAGNWTDRSKLEKLCGLGICINLGTTLSLILAFIIP
jgi:1,4-dihydroxy-2-naphthoate polyprenyltransferase